MNETLAKKIIRMVEMDQTVRFHAVAAAEGRTTAGPGTENYLIYSVDLSHGVVLKDIVREFGYPSADLIGNEGLHAWWLLVQHQDFDTEFQKNCLDHMEFTPIDRAYLTDRILINAGKKQRYGTQFDQPIEDEERVDAWRAEAGLEPLAEYLEKRTVR